MESSIGQRKISDLGQLTAQFKIYKQTYQNRVLPPKNVHTYLQLTKFISQLSLTCLSHYSGILTPQETNSFVQEMMNFNDDVLSKLKTLAERAQKKETLQPSPKNNLEICRICLRELRTIEVTTTKEEMQSQSELSKSIFKVIKEIQEDSVPFTKDEDRNFFRELSFALEKKQEVIELCASESQQFTRTIENQLRELSSIGDFLTLQGQRKEANAGNKSNELKQNVSRSIKQTIYSKLPIIISIVGRNLKKSWQRQQKMKNHNAETQTCQFESTKVIDLKRKLVQAESVSTLAVQERQKMHWTIHEKDMMIAKVEDELKVERQEANKKEFQLQKEVRSLEQKCRKLREEVQKQKLKSRRQLEYRETESNIRTMKTLNKLKEVSMMEEQQIKRRQQLEEQLSNEDSKERKRKKKKTLYNTKGSNKFFLPTLTKINREESQLMSKSDFGEDQLDTTILNQTIKTEIVNQSPNQDSIIETDHAKGKLSKTNGLLKRGKNEVKKMMTMVHNKEVRSPRKSKERKISKSNLKKKTSIDRQKESRILGTKKSVIEEEKMIERGAPQNNQGSLRLPFITQRNTTREGNSKQDKTSRTPDSKKSVKISETREVRDSVKFQELDKEKENKIRNSFTSLNSGISISHRIMTEIKEPNKDRQSILKPRSLKRKQESHQIGDFANLHTDPNSPTENRKLQQNQHKTQSQRNTHTKESFEKINEDIEKEGYVTPVIGVESPGFQKKAELHKRISDTIQKNLEKIFESMTEDSQELLKVSYQQFGAMFAQCLSSLRSSQSAPKSPPMTLKQEQSSPLYKNVIQPISFHSKDQNNCFKDMKSVKKPQLSIFQQLSINKMNMGRQVRYSTETSTLNKKLQAELSKEPLSIHFKQNNNNTDNSLTQTLRYKSKISKEPSQEKNELSPKQSFLKKKKINQNRQRIETVNLNANLFVNQERAYEYESNFSKKLKLGPLLPEVQSYANNLFQALEEIKYLNSQTYQQVCSYLRYPFTHCQQGSFHIDIIKSISLPSMIQCFQRIVPLHRKCKTERGLCLHFVDFQKKIQKFVNQFSS